MVLNTRRFAAGILIGSACAVAIAAALPVSAAAKSPALAPTASARPAVAPSGGTCDSLTALNLPHTRITTAEVVAAGAFSVPGAARQNAAFKQLPEFCRVAVTLTPAADSRIQMELWLPTGNWNGKFLAVGNGGWAGTIVTDALAAGLARGYAAASNDTGHSDAGAAFATHPDKVIDFGYRAMHEMTMESKAIVAKFYERGPRLSYYQGCSTGGRQGMMEAQRYPDDFDAIIAGAPVYNQVTMNVSQTALQVDMLKNPARIVPAAKVALFARAVMSACDAKDGVTDGIIGNPLQCTFDPGTLECKSGDGPDCLTAPQIESARQLYGPARLKSGANAYPGRVPGVESGWAARIPTPGAPMNPLWADMPRFVGHQDASWDPMTFDFDADLALALKHGSVIEANDPNLAKFKARGGKLLLWQGWADPGPSPLNTIDYYSSVVKTLGGASQQDWMRLFLLPGVGHCGGGIGPDQADFLGALEQWREQGAPPASIVASRNPNPGRGAALAPMSRPVCPYPQVAKYTGTGSTDEAKNFACAAP
jgi:tannase/feruloyl esterase